MSFLTEWNNHRANNPSAGQEVGETSQRCLIRDKFSSELLSEP